LFLLDLIKIKLYGIGTENNLKAVLSCFETYSLQGFRSKNLEEGESNCVSQCSAKHMKLAQRVGERLGEYQAMKAQQQNQQQQQPPRK
jgi:Tim10/DDP family zinc finger